MKNTLLIALFIGVAHVLTAQVESEIGFKYIKAKYLVDTERYEEAIVAFTQIINENASYEDALLYRAEAKYFMSAYSGAEKDAIDYMHMKGVSPKALNILGKASYKNGNAEAATKTLQIASVLSNDAVVDEYLGNSLQAAGDIQGACKAWSKAAANGSSNAAIKSQQNCAQRPTYIPPAQDHTTHTPPSQPSKGGVVKIEIPGQNDSRGTQPVPSKPKPTSTTTTSPGTQPTVPNNGPAVPPVDDTKNRINIDNELSIDIYGQGLGKRKVMDKPNILILSDTDGVVTVDICVNARGKVASAEYNSGKSTLSKEHLISLAIRKAKEFWFDTSEYRQQCGVMQFHISKM